MKIEILGCSGGIGEGLKTTTFLIDDHLLLDAGSGLELLTKARMLSIRSVLITHAHIDHILGLPLMLATLFDEHREPIEVFALPEVIDALKTHIFNGIICPDYTSTPTEKPILSLKSINVGDTITIRNKVVEVLPSVHVTPTAGFMISADQRGFVYTGDTTSNDQLWPIINARRPDMIAIDVSYTDEDSEQADNNGHLSPARLAEQLKQLTFQPKIWVTNMKPGHEEEIIGQCLRQSQLKPIDHLRQGQLIVL
ncbi:MAG: 3',5'-cyclic-nucleotide phosphodiesterase [Amphritea sp.]|nr:3',5'-cyclic-nucleotide phosphodiesterase [Amphritea sp.]